MSDRLGHLRPRKMSRKDIIRSAMYFKYYTEHTEEEVVTIISSRHGIREGIVRKVVRRVYERKET